MELEHHSPFTQSSLAPGAHQAAAENPANSNIPGAWVLELEPMFLIFGESFSNYPNLS